MPDKRSLHPLVIVEAGRELKAQILLFKLGGMPACYLMHSHSGKPTAPISIWKTRPRSFGISLYALKVTLQ